ncbi:hypothetical protein SAMN05446935_3454 [Burkholderia sp. YR290]|jgi:hypothetical protein|nr:hypothetical protein PMI06_007225 [Burkholderia sp. BT03]SKC91402.1 hypothetical protein SAMN06266956_4828 [Paraburkholderia hospita]SOE69240.1 hypothetical protein SAMN05446935_3454 [Burkholderia sp. YR290]
MGLVRVRVYIVRFGAKVFEKIRGTARIWCEGVSLNR